MIRAPILPAVERTESGYCVIIYDHGALWLGKGLKEDSTGISCVSLLNCILRLGHNGIVPETHKRIVIA